jgi:hypothetical protein
MIAQLKVQTQIENQKDLKQRKAIVTRVGQVLGLLWVENAMVNVRATKVRVRDRDLDRSRRK